MDRGLNGTERRPQDVPEELHRALEALDARARHSASRVDPRAVADSVLARLRAAPDVEVRPPLWRRNAVRVAAAAALLAGAAGALSLFGGGETRVADSREGNGVRLPVVTWDSIGQSEAQALLAAVDESRLLDTNLVLTQTVTLHDLTEEELRALLQAMESVGEQ